MTEELKETVKETAAEEADSRYELPTPQVSLEVQLEILKAIAVINETKGNSCSYKDIASKVDANETNVSRSLKFWKGAGLIIESSRGKYSPSKALIDFNKKIQWGSEDEAWKIIHDALENSWFVTEMKIKFQLKSKLTQDELTRTLGLASGKSNKDSGAEKAVGILIQLLESSKWIAKDQEGNYSLLSSSSAVKNLAVEEGKDMIQVGIGDDVFALEVQQLKDFVLKNGKKISRDVQRVE